ncbi:MAG: transcriptional regulator, TetR family-like protein [Ramlibacter sp.]|jgi:AcrR family transcriptional regulator|uniref:TetR/AcrR family transcriptional regulator n=1 Tax=Ramlibacter sp. TaxID=1917967 RepID=UPI00262E3D1E|nr:TetR/AcrR family transcriptional regulator [Ramlibacter sp.]MDB5751143.1 transcriptional regulator, TetR family-like protein [Ramlibacter sp.]
MSVAQLPPHPARAPREGKALQKGQQTKAAIVDAALALATQIGLEGLSIGALADATQMSKSGVFAHFGSREELQISVVREYHARFEQQVFYPAVGEPRGLPRLRAMFANWMKLTSVELDSGCIYISGAVEFDDRPGPVRDALAWSVQTWHEAMRRAITLAKDEGHLRAEVEEEQMLFEIHGLILALHYEARFLKNPGSIARAHTGFENILQRYGVPAVAVAAKSAPKSRPTARAAKE